MTLYMKVSNDEYQLPEIIARTTIELAEKCGVKSQTVRSAMSHGRSTAGRASMYEWRWKMMSDMNGTPCISGGYTSMMTEEDSDLIRRSDALECFHDWVDKYGDVHTPDEMAEYRAIEELPSAQPEKCEECGNFNKARLLISQPQRTGRWIDDNCSECGQYVYHGDMRNFCPKCGADMREAKNEAD